MHSLSRPLVTPNQQSVDLSMSPWSKTFGSRSAKKSLLAVLLLVVRVAVIITSRQQQGLLASGWSSMLLSLQLPVSRWAQPVASLLLGFLELQVRRGRLAQLVRLDL